MMKCIGKKMKKAFGLCLFFLLLSMAGYGQNSVFHSYALFVQSFARYSSWPTSNGKLKIAVLGASKAYEEMQRNISGKSFGGSEAVVVKVSDLSEALDANIIYVSEDASGRLGQLVKSTENLPVMIIAEGEGLYKRGASVSFVVVSNRLRYDVNSKEFERRHLKASSQLLSLANDVL